MRVISRSGSKKRLFEVFNKVCGVELNESKISDEEILNIVNDFVKYVSSLLNFGDNIPNIVLSNDDNEAEIMKSFGKYTPDLNEIRIVIANRNLADSLRSLAHELVHHKQKLDNKLRNESGITGSPEENEANAMAGVLMRNYGKINPTIFK